MSCCDYCLFRSPRASDPNRVVAFTRDNGPSIGDPFAEGEADPIRMLVFAHRLQSPSERPTDDPCRFLEMVWESLPDDVRTTVDLDALPNIHSMSEALCHITALMPVYYLEHSDFAYSTSSFADSWDSGVVGWLWCPEDELKDLAPDREQALAAFRERAPWLLERYDAWAHGDVWIATDDDDACVIAIGEGELASVAAELLGVETSDLEEVEPRNDNELNEILEQEADRTRGYALVHGFAWPLASAGTPVKHGMRFKIRETDEAVFRVEAVEVDGHSNLATVTDRSSGVSVVLDLGAGERLISA